jgi:hypothetical protein
MQKLFIRAGLTAAVLLSYSQFAATQVAVTESRAKPMLDTRVSIYESAVSNETKRDDLESTRALAGEHYAIGRSAAQAVEPTEFTVYPGPEVTLNGMPVYVSARIKTGDRVKTSGATGKLTVGNVILDLGLETTIVIQEPIVLNCGVISVRSGTIAINDGKKTLSFSAGQTAYATSTSCGGQLPDSPGTAQAEANSESTQRSQSRHHIPSEAASGLIFDAREAGWPFWAANAAMFGSSVAAAEMTHKCLEAGACSFVPDTFHRRRNMYLIGMPVAAGVSYFSYHLKRKGYRWWFVPAALVTVGNVVVITHAARYR